MVAQARLHSTENGVGRRSYSQGPTAGWPAFVRFVRPNWTRLPGSRQLDGLTFIVGSIGVTGVVGTGAVGVDGFGPEVGGGVVVVVMVEPEALVVAVVTAVAPVPLALEVAVELAPAAPTVV